MSPLPSAAGPSTGAGTDDFLRLGPAPRPSATELERRIRDAILTQLIVEPGTTVRGTEHVDVDVQMAGTAINALHIDASGVEIDVATDTVASVDDQETAEAEIAGGEVDDEGTAEVGNREPGMLRRGTFVAAPLRFQDIPVDVEATAVNVPLEWLELKDGGLGLGLGIVGEMSHQSRRAVRLQLSVTVNPDDATAAVMRVMHAELAEVEGIHVDRGKLTLTQLGPRRIRFGLSARVRWKFLRPTLRARTELHIDNRFVVRLRRTRVTSSNPLLAVVLRLLRGRINRELNKPIALNDNTAPLDMRGLRIDAGGNRLRVELEFGLI